MNASDQRNKAVIAAKVGYLMDNTTLTRTHASGLSEKNLIIMDEVDGMGGNEDKGGVSALIEIVKKTKVPIICICNDIHHPKLKSLLNHCYELRFNRPEKRHIVKRMYDICKSEGFNVETNALDYLCDSVNGDIRQIVNFLELKSRMTKGLDANELKSNFSLHNKDSLIMISAFDSCKKMLTKSEFKRMSFREKMDLFFVDFDLLPSLIHVSLLYNF